MKQKLKLVPYPALVRESGGVCPPALQGNVTGHVSELPGGPEAYELDITPDGIQMTGSPAGILYAKITLEQLKLEFPTDLPCLHIEDAPRFPYRGFMLDCCRHFFSEPDVMTLIDAASYYKINKFHWHLSDDQGWRVAIEKYPRLTEIGAQTGGASSRPEFYTKRQIRRIVKFAQERNVEIIPEIDIPGHMTAAIAAYPELGCTGQTMPVATDFGVFPNLICAGREECFQFLTDVLDELCELFPSKTIHIGGDEAAKEHWKSCPYCQAKMRELGFGDEDTLQRWYSDRIIQYLNAKGREARLWSDAFTGNDFQAEQYSIQYWMGNPGNVKYQAALGHKIVCSDTAAYYMDYPYAADDRAGSRVSVEDRAGREKISPEEDLRNREEAAEKLAQYTHPINLDTILEHDPWPDWLAGGRTPALRSALLGIEAPLWTEYVPDLSTAVQRLFPRLPAVAEVAWTPELSRDNASFDERYESTAAQFAQRRLKGAAGKRLWHG